MEPAMADARYAEAVRRQRGERDAVLERRRAKRELLDAWKAGLVQPFVITHALDARDLYGPAVDEACGVCEPTVDRWEAGECYPTIGQLRALAVLTGFPVRFFTTAHEPVAFEDTSMRFHLRKRDKPPPPIVLCFLPEAIHAATGTARCPYCGLDYRPGIPTVLHCPLCRAEQAGRTRFEDGVACCPGCGGSWRAGGP
jgi:hypothetical protein